MVRVSVARSLHEIEHLRSAWESLEQGRACTMFQSFAWNHTVARVFGSREQPFVVHAESDSGAALIPASIVANGSITFLGDVLFDYRDILAVGDPRVQQAAWRRLAELRMPLSVTALRGDPVRHAWHGLEPRPFVHAPQIVRADRDASGLAAAHRRLGRLWRRALRSGALLREYDGSASSLLRWIYEQKAAHPGARPENLFRDPVRVEFMVAVAAANPAVCDIFVLELESRIMAALVTFRDRDTRRFYTVYYDQEFAHYSPGNILLFEICRRTLEQGMNCDLMTGEQPYKQRLASCAVPLFKVDASADALARFAGITAPVTEVAA